MPSPDITRIITALTPVLTAGADLEVTGEAGVDASRLSGPAKDTDDMTVSSPAKQMCPFIPHS